MQELNINEIVELVHQKALANMYAGPAHREESPTLPDLIKSLGVAQVVKSLDWLNYSETDANARLTAGIRRLYSKTCGDRAYMGSDVLQIMTAFPECDILRTLQLAELARIEKGVSKLPYSFIVTLTEGEENA
tara:strand:- start:2 stop:400 length:399 start_codon:yes stop_codon:yes gene_type:complete